MPRLNRALRKEQTYMLAFLFMAIISATIIAYTAIERNDDSDDDYALSERKKYGQYKKKRNSDITYSQEDIGYGDGSTASPDAQLALRPFPFDPNTADSTTLLRLGLAPWQVRCIYRYRAHGGCYRKAEDFAKLPGLTLKDYNSLKPYIRIHREVMAADALGKGNTSADNTKSSTEAREKYRRSDKITLSDEKIDINTADTTLLKRIPGIGSYFAKRIVDWRQRHRRIVNVDDLLAIRNFPQYALAYMTTGAAPPPIRINSMTLQQLQAHSLLTHTQAADIIRLRKTTGHINSIEEMRNLSSFREGELARIAPYIVFD